LTDEDESPIQRVAELHKRLIYARRIRMFLANRIGLIASQPRSVVVGRANQSEDIMRFRSGNGLTTILLGLLAFVLASSTTCLEARAKGNDPLRTLDSVAACSNVEPPPVADHGLHSDDDRFAMPPNPEGPTLVDLGLFIVDINRIDEVENTFRMQGFVDLVWCDPRLAFDPEATTDEEEVFLEQDAELELERIWWPDLNFANQTEPRKRENLALVIRSDGTVNYEELFVVVLKSPFDLRRFPFDRQQLEVKIESFSWTDEVLRFHEEAGKIGFSDSLEMPEWQIRRVELSVTSSQEVRDRATFSKFLLQIEVARKPGYYLWKLVLPLILLICASWIVFWLTDWMVSRRLGLAFRGVLIVVAYQFVISGSLPRVSYLTLMDSFLMFSFIMMLLTILQNTVVSHYYLKDRLEFAHQIDAASRWLFPIVYLIGSCSLLAIYLR